MPYTALISNLRALPQETLTSDQREALFSLLDYLEAPSPYALYLLTGYAGTGKTYLLRSNIEHICFIWCNYRYGNRNCSPGIVNRLIEEFWFYGNINDP